MSFPDINGINEIIRHPREERNIEFKESVPWQDNRFKAKIIKSILGMANIRDGGWIVIGKRELPDGTYEPSGMTDDDYNIYEHDVVVDFVREYADPYVKIFVYKQVLDQKKFVVIRIEEFESTPVICKKSWGNILHRGKIYTRSKIKPETIEVPSEVEMREIIDMAVDKKIKEFFTRLSSLGAPSPAAISEDRDRELFAKQLEGIL